MSLADFILVFLNLCVHMFSTWLARARTWWIDVVSHQGISLIHSIDGYSSLASSIINKPNILLQPLQLIQIPRKETVQGNRVPYFQLFPPTNKFGNSFVFFLFCFVFVLWLWFNKNILGWSLAVWFIKTLTYINVYRYGC